MKAQPFNVIPVLDVRHGVAVRAVAGDRANYQPLVTPLTDSADPVAVAQGYQRLYPFPSLYVADLDGIEGRGANTAMLAMLLAQIPGLEIWADNGSADFAGVSSVLENSQITAVIGTESRLEGSELRRLTGLFGDRKVSSPRNAITEQSGTITVGDDTTAFKVTLEYTVQGSEMTFKLDSKPFAIVSIDGPSKGKTPVSDIKIEKKLTVVELKKPGQETGMSIRLRFDGK